MALDLGFACFYLQQLKNLERVQKINDLNNRGELPGHSLANNIIANFSIGVEPINNLRVYNCKGPQVSYVNHCYDQMCNNTANFLNNNFHNHHSLYKNARCRGILLFCFLLILAFTMFGIAGGTGIGGIHIVGLFFLLLAMLFPIFYHYYLKHIKSQYSKEVLPKLTNFIQNDLLNKYCQGTGIKVYLLYPLKWNLDMNECCDCSVKIKWYTIRFTLGDIQQPHGGPIYWSGTPNGHQMTVLVANQNLQNQVNQTYGSNPTTQEITPMIQNGNSGGVKTAFESDHNKKQVSAPIENKFSELPHGWRQAYTKEGRIYFINDNNQTTQWNHPGIMNN